MFVDRYHSVHATLLAGEPLTREKRFCAGAPRPSRELADTDAKMQFSPGVMKR